MRIQPNEGITLKFGAKLPGQFINIRPASTWTSAMTIDDLRLTIDDWCIGSSGIRRASDNRQS